MNMQKQINCQKVFKITRVIAVILIIISIFYFFTLLLSVVNYNVIKNNIDILAQKNKETMSINIIIFYNLLTFIFLFVSGIGLFKLQKWAAKLYYIIAIWYFLFYLGILNLFLQLLGGLYISSYRLLIAYVLGIMGVYIYRNKECFNKNEKIQSIAT